ncbi:MAG: hypothetical protein DPW11_04280 [bacterium]|nr:hypothetical protein [Candidatus Microgenomates bacterium CPR3]MCQ3944961.1 hypothetical protein [bacterium]
MQATPDIDRLLAKVKNRLSEWQKQFNSSYQEKADSLTTFQKIFFGIFLILAVYFYGVYKTKLELLSRLTPATVITPTPTPRPSVLVSPSPSVQASVKPSTNAVKASIAPKPTTTPTPTPQLQSQPSWPDRPTAEATVKAKAMKEWGDDYRMVEYEFNLQMDAYSWLIQQTQYPDIMKRAQREWVDDYRMVKYEYENQVKSYQAIH